MMPYFECLTPRSLQKIKYTLGDNLSHDIEGRGTIMITLDSGEARTLENVLYILALKIK